MKNIFFLGVVLCFINSFGQDDTFQFTAGYGLFYNEFEVLNDIPNIDYTTPKIGKMFEFSADYALSNNRFVGLGFAVTSNTSTVNSTVLFEEGLGLSFDNFRLEYENQFYDIHFRKEFKDHFHLTVGAIYYRYFSPNLGFKMMPYKDRGILKASLSARVGTDQNIMKQYIDKVAVVLSALPEMKAYYTKIDQGTINLNIELIHYDERMRK